jgi:hypothetical protein
MIPHYIHITDEVAMVKREFVEEAEERQCRCDVGRLVVQLLGVWLQKAPTA